MSKQIFINLPVKDVEKSMNFYESLGFTNNPQFSDDTAKCMVWSEDIYLMLLSLDKFNSFATKPIADTKNNLAALFSLSMDSVESMNKMMQNWLEAWWKEPHELRDLWFMQQRSIEDFDWHTWEIFLWIWAVFLIN